MWWYCLDVWCCEKKQEQWSEVEWGVEKKKKGERGNRGTAGQGRAKGRGRGTVSRLINA